MVLYYSRNNCVSSIMYFNVVLCCLCSFVLLRISLPVSVSLPGMVATNDCVMCNLPIISTPDGPSLLCYAACLICQKKVRQQISWNKNDDNILEFLKNYNNYDRIDLALSNRTDLQMLEGLALM